MQFIAVLSQELLCFAQKGFDFVLFGSLFVQLFMIERESFWLPGLTIDLLKFGA